MKNGKKILFVMAASVLALITGCQNTSSSTSSSSSQVTSSELTTSEVSTSEASSTTSETPVTSETTSNVEESSTSSVDSTTSETPSSDVSSEAPSSELPSSSEEVSSSEEHVHAYGDWEIVKEPTLTDAGTAKRTCSCGDVDAAVVPALNDRAVWSVKSSNPADHFKGGVTIYESIYGEVTVTSVKGDHTFGAWAIVTEPTLTAGGKAERTCSADTYKEEVNLPALTDTTVWTVKSEKPATHFADGEKVYTSDYGDVTVVLPKGEHTYGDWTITTKPTSTEGGKAEKVCSVDNDKVVVDIPALSDASVWKVESFPGETHADEGKNVYTSIYGKVEVKIPAGEHVYGAWVIKAQPTLTTTGKAEKTCTVTGCTHVEEVTLPALSDTTVWTAVETKPTHTEAGYTTYTSEYGTVVVEGDPATGHTEYGDWTLVDEPTLTATGSATRTCSCGHVDEVVVPVLTNEEVWTAVPTAPTHTEAGFTTYTSVYGEVVVDGDPALGHAASGKYTAVTDNGVVSIYEVCEDDDGGYVGEAVKTMDATIAAEYDIDLSLSTPWTVDPENPNKYISSNKEQNSSSSYIEIVFTSDGLFKLDWTVSSEAKYDKIYIKKGTTTLVDGKSGIENGNISINVTAGEKLTIYYQKDSSGNKNDDQATITIAPSSISYSALTLNVNGGTACEPLFIENGAILGDLPSPTQEGKYFEGWYTDAECTTAYGGEALEGDATLYAKWSNAQTVTFHTNGSEAIDDVVFQIGTTPTMPEDPVRDGYYFIGWYTDEGLTEKYASGNKNTSFDLYAKWIAVEDAHTLYGNYAGFKFQLSSSFSASTSYAELSVDVEGNFALRRYYSGYVNGTFGAVTDGKVANETVGIANVYEDGNVVIMSDTKSISSSSYLFVMVKDATASTTGVTGSVIMSGDYAFVNFPVGDKNVTIMVDRATGAVHYDVTLKEVDGTVAAAKDANNLYVINVIKGDATIATFYKDSSSYTTTNDTYEGVYGGADDASLTLSGAGKAGFSVIGTGIYSYEVVETNVVYVFYSSSARYLVTLDVVNKTFTYVERKVDVTFDFGYEVDSVEKTVSTQFVYDYWTDFPEEVLKPTREGYVFKGWFNNSEFTGSSYTRSKVTANTTYYAKWVEALTLTVYNNNGTKDPVVTVLEKGTTPVLTAPTKDGYLFAGWYTDAELTEEYVSENKETNVVVYAKYVEAPFYVGTFKGENIDDSNWGKTTKSTSTSYQANITADGKVTGKLTSTWTIEGYDASSSKLTLGNGNKFFVKETASGIVFGLAQYNSLNFDSMSWDDYGFYAKANGDDTITFDDIYFNNGYNKIIKITVGDKVAYVYTDGKNKAVYADVTFTDFSGNAIAFDDIYSSETKKLTSELVIKQGEVVVARVKASSNDTKYGYVFDDGKTGTYNGNINGSTGSIVLDGYGYATVTIGEDAPVSATYAFDDGKLVVTINSKAYKFTVGEANALTQILDGLEGTYTYAESNLVLTGYGLGTLGSTACTYDVFNATTIKIKVGEVETILKLDIENKTATAIVMLDATYSVKYNFYCGYAQYEAETKLKFSSDGKCKISSISSEHEADCPSDYYMPSFTGDYEYVIDGNTITLTKGTDNFVFTLSEDKSTITLVSTTYSSSTKGIIPAGKVLSK